MADVRGLIAYGIIDGDANEGVVELCLNAAKRWFKNAGVPEPEGNDSLYDMGVYQLATFYYDRREPSGVVNFTAPPPYGIQGIVLQLKDLGG